MLLRNALTIFGGSFAEQKKLFFKGRAVFRQRKNGRGDGDFERSKRI